MFLEYDLVIIGASPEGIYAARQAIQYHKRVALVEQGLNGQSQNFTCSISKQITTFSQHYNCVQSLGYISESLSSNLLLETTQHLIQTISKVDFRSNQLAVLAASGVDIILGSGSFSLSSRLSFDIDNRQLRSRAYLLATSSISRIPKILGLEKIDYLTPLTFQQYQIKKIAQTWTILGSTPVAIALAQYLVSLDQKVILISRNAHIFPQEDREVCHLLQAQLEAMGIQIITQNQIQEVRFIEKKKQVVLAKQVIETDEILLASGNQPQINDLNLDKIKVEFDQTKIFTNSQLQTTHPQVYACGSLLGGYDIPEIAEYEVRVVLNNIFSAKKIHVNYSLIPYSFSTYPTFARIGLTEIQARQQQNNIKVIKAYFKSQSQTQFLDTTVGICKLIIDSKKEILGVHILGSHAAELISFFTLAIQQKIKLDQLLKINSPSPIFAEILQQLSY